MLELITHLILTRFCCIPYSTKFDWGNRHVIQILAMGITYMLKQELIIYIERLKDNIHLCWIVNYNGPL